VASWHNGSSAAIANSQDGPWPNGLATTGVEGLKTIVPLHGVSQHYSLWHMGGVMGSTGAAAFNRASIHLDQVTQGNQFVGNPPGVNLPARGAICLFTRQFLLNDANTDLGDGDAHQDINTFWRERDYVKDAGLVKAAVFAVFGTQSDSVRMDQLSPWWAALKAGGAPRKLWLTRSAAVDPFDFRRAEWVDVLHRWFDHWLYGVPNGIMSEPPVAIEDAVGVWRDYPDWPVPGARDTDLYLRAGADPAAAGRWVRSPAAAGATRSATRR
jgi:X-Pro dipeptidyl-peptidase